MLMIIDSILTTEEVWFVRMWVPRRPKLGWYERRWTNDVHCDNSDGLFHGVYFGTANERLLLLTAIPCCPAAGRGNFRCRARRAQAQFAPGWFPYNTADTTVCEYQDAQWDDEYWYAVPEQKISLMLCGNFDLNFLQDVVLLTIMPLKWFLNN